MLFKNTLLTCLLPFLATVMPVAHPPVQPKRWVISQSSSLSVNGSTNINKFACDIPEHDRTDTLVLTSNKTDKGITLTGCIDLKIQSFDCHNSIMTHDLRTTLKEKQFPRLRINFLSLSELPELSPKPKPITGWVIIELAGASKRFEINYQASVDAQRCIHLLGARDVNFSDFNLIPPRKLGGMIKTNDQLSVQFHLKITAIDNL